MAPSPPRSLYLSDLDTSSMTLGWKPPLENGGSKITGYCVEKCDELTDDWIWVAEVNPFDTSYKLTDLKVDVGYLFSVTAKNCIGYGNPCLTNSPVKLRRKEGE